MVALSRVSELLLGLCLGLHLVDVGAATSTTNTATTTSPTITPATAFCVHYGFDGNTADNGDFGPFDGELIGNAQYTSGGRDGQALSFDGHRCVQMGTWSMPNEQISFSAWALPYSFSSDNRILTKASSSSTQDHVFMLSISNQYDQGYRWRGCMSTDEGEYIALYSTTTASLSTWVHLGVTYDGYTASLWVNGVVEDSESLSGRVRSSSDEVQIGCQADKPGWHGLIDDVRICGSVLDMSVVFAENGAFYPGATPTLEASPTDPPTERVGLDTATDPAGPVDHEGIVVEDVSWEGMCAHYGFDGDTTDDGDFGPFDGELFGTSQYTSDGRDGQALSFDGNSCVQMGTWSMPSEQISFSAWALPYSFSSDNRILTKASSSSTQDHVFMLSISNQYDQGYRWRGRMSTDEGEYIALYSTTTASLYTWVHLGVTYDGYTASLWVDGVVEDSGSLSGRVRSSYDEVQIGCQADKPGWHGLIDDVRICGSVLDMSAVFAENGAFYMGASPTLEDSPIEAATDQATDRPSETPTNPPTDEPVEDASWDGLCVHYGFDGNTGDDGDFGPFNGELIGNAQYTLADGGRDGQALSFDGKSCVKTGTWSMPSLQISFSAWVLPYSFTDPYDDNRILSKADGTADEDHVFMLSGVVAERWRARLSTVTGETVVLFSTSTADVGEWAHLGVTYDGFNALFWINGMVEDSAQLSGRVSITDDEVTIGCQDFKPSWDGLIDDVRICGSVLDMSAVYTENGVFGGGVTVEDDPTAGPTPPPTAGTTPSPTDAPTDAPSQAPSAISPAPTATTPPDTPAPTAITDPPSQSPTSAPNDEETATLPPTVTPAEADVDTMSDASQSGPAFAPLLVCGIALLAFLRSQ